MTYNIQYGGGDLEVTIAAIKAVDPDLVALQEVDVHWGARIRVPNGHLDYRPDPAVRSQQVREALEVVGASTAPALMVGDFNAVASAPELQSLRRNCRTAGRSRQTTAGPTRRPDRWSASTMCSRRRISVWSPRACPIREHRTTARWSLT